MSYFADRTIDTRRFVADVGSRELKHLLNLLRDDNEQKSIILPDVLCPWGSTEFCFKAGHCEMALLMQNELLKVVLNMSTAAWYNKLHLVKTPRWDYLRGQVMPCGKVKYTRDVFKNATDMQWHETDCSPGNELGAGHELNDYSACCAEDVKEYDSVILNNEWPILSSVVLSASSGLMVMT